MKQFLLAALSASAFVVVLSNAAEDPARQEKFEALYEKWHQILDANQAILTEPSFFSTESGPPELVATVTEIKRNGLTMADFLCEKLAGETAKKERLYRDVLLLERVTGIDLLRAEDQPFRLQNFSVNMSNFTARFREEWQQGVYKDPSKKIARLCEDRLPKEKGSSIEPVDVVALRRYGVYGLPEIVKQIKKNDSKHAFAAYLITTGQREQYAAYILETDKQFPTKEAKIEHIKDWVEKLKNGAENLDLTKRISAALATK